MLSQLVKQGNAASGPAGMPVVRPGGGPGHGGVPLPSASPGHPGGPASPLPMGAQAPMQPGFDHRQGDGTTAPFSAFGNRTPYGQLPPGAPPLSTANQLAALEIDDIPESFKLAHQASKRRKRAVTGVVILCVCVLLGVGLGMLVFRGEPEAPKTKTIEVVSIPAGATVTIDGREVEGKTPLSHSGVAVGTSYLIGVTYPGHKPWSSETEVSTQGGTTVKVIARLEAQLVKLKLSSEPSGAQVLLNGSPVGQTPLELDELDPRTTKYVELRLRGYRPIREDLEWGDDTEKTLSFKLQK